MSWHKGLPVEPYSGLGWNRDIQVGKLVGKQAIVHIKGCQQRPGVKNKGSI